MARSIPVEAKRRGRPPGAAFADPVPVRLTPDQLADVDQWREDQPDQPSRSEAIRRLLEYGLRRKR